MIDTLPPFVSWYIPGRSTIIEKAGIKPIFFEACSATSQVLGQAHYSHVFSKIF
jgi:hypothetical protein